MYQKVKVYSDGSHYIGIPYEPNPRARRPRPRREEVIEVREPEVVSGDVPTAIEKDEQPSRNLTDIQPKSAPSVKRMTRKELFDELYQATIGMKKRERKAQIRAELRPYFRDDTSCRAFVEENFARKHRNMICRKIRLWRKINHQKFNYFVTFTYSDEKHDEESFRKKLIRCIQHFSSRKGWLYIGAWERAPETGRLHFHGIFYIPEGAMTGEIETLRDFDVRAKRMRSVEQNTFFAKKFGRNEFRPICHAADMPNIVRYLMKYIEKSGGKLVYSRGLYQYFVTDIMDEDVVCPYGLEDRKLLLFDDFTCWDEGEYIGPVSRETIARLPQCA